MSQDSTYVPAMENAGSNQTTSSLYSRPSSSFKVTVVPGMAPMSNGQASNLVETTSAPVSSGEAVSTGLPVIGFLYSISNHGIPEYWPVVLGYNRIGRDADNEIVLHEQTVSGLHASIMVQKRHKTGEVVSIIRLERGRTGVLINDEEVDLRYGSECKNGDILTIGENYKFILILIDAEASGLSVAKNFMPTAVETEEEEEEVPTMLKQRPISYATNGTVALDGSAPQEMPGGTRFM